MKKIVSEYGDSGDLMVAREAACEGKHFRFIVIIKRGGHSGAVGGGFNYEILGTNNLREVLKADIIRDADEILDIKAGKKIEKNKLAREFLKSLSKAQKEALVDEMLEKFLIAE